MKYFKIILFALSVVLFTSCVKFPKPTPETPDSKIPVDFDWKTVQDIKLTIQVSPIAGIPDTYTRIIKIYTSPLLKDGSMVASGAAKPGVPYVVTISLPMDLKKLYIQEVLPTGTKTVKIIEISGTNMTFTTSATSKPDSKVSLNASFSSPSVPVPANYDVEITNNSSVNFVGFGPGESSAHGNTYKSYIIKEGVNRTSSISLSNWQDHAILYVKGTYDVNSANIGKASLVILPGGVVRFSNSLSNGTVNATAPPVIYIHEGGSLYIGKTTNISGGGVIVNKGTITANDVFGINNSSIIYNEGIIQISKSGKGVEVTNNSQMFNSGNIDVKKFELTVGATTLNDIGGRITTANYYQTNLSVMNNHHQIVATGTFETSSSAVTNNFCNITANITDLKGYGGSVNLYGGSLWETQTLKVGGNTITMHGGSMMITNNFSELNAMTLKSASDQYSVFKVTGSLITFMYKSSSISGNIEFVYSNLTDGSGTNGRVNYEHLFTDGLSILTKNQTKNISATTCNDGKGQIVVIPPSITDNDGDGVQQGEDIDDNDPTIAFASYFPNESGWASYAFEDLYPWPGDYDMNDLVLVFKITKYSNSSNKFTMMKFDYLIKASGSSKDLAAAFQLDKITASNVSSVTGDVAEEDAPFPKNPNGTEAGVSLAVIPLFNTIQSIVPVQNGPFLNTVSGKHTNIQQKSITIRFISPVESSDLSVNNAFNFFIIRNDNGQKSRGLEIHLPTFSPTSKVDMSVLAGGQLHPSDKYKTKDGMMWGILIPEVFEHPYEGNVVSSAYLRFEPWAFSGGTDYTDWYKNIEGYRDNTKIYSVN